MTVSPVKPLSSASLDQELHRIGAWWLDHAIDSEFGGFFGEIDNFGLPIADATKNIILNTRILWFFSEASRVTNRQEYRDAAERAFEYIATRFVDSDEGGLFWELDAQGNPVNLRKQTYGQAFGIYALSAHYRLTQDGAALSLAEAIFDKMEHHCRQAGSGGYLEGFARDWQVLDDMRLSEVDVNSPLSMNNHLHVLEAYTLLMRVSDDPRVLAAVTDLLKIFRRHIIGPADQMRLFFDSNWQPMCGASSCGHDIEASWLLLEAGRGLGDAETLAWLEPAVLKMAYKCFNSGMHDGLYVINEIDEDGTRDLTAPWWVEAEALVGFLHMHALSGDAKFLAVAERIWAFIQQQHLDYESGEWLWDARRDPLSAHRDYKAGAWKGPYHNGRSMMEAAALMRSLESSTPSNTSSSKLQMSHG